MRPILLLLFGLVLTSASFGQFNNTEHEFIRYLLQTKQQDEAIFILKQKLLASRRLSERDSINFLIGKTHYSNQKLEEATFYLHQVGNTNALLQDQSVFLYAYSKAFLNDYEEAYNSLSGYALQEPSLVSLKTFELSGVALLSKNFSAFDSLQQNFNSDRLEVKQRQENFMVYRRDLQKLKTRSPFIAATLSGIIPGLGRVYGGKKATGIYSFIAGSLLGLQVYEAYRKDGINSPRFIIYGTLFSAFYIGNIWGSALSVKISRNEKEEAIRHQVLVDMHIPLRAVFQ